MNKKAYWDRLEALAWMINEREECVDYIDHYAPYPLVIESKYDMYLANPYDKRHQEIIARWYKGEADKEDMDLVYDFFCEAFDKDLLEEALIKGDDKSLLAFIRHAYEESGIKIGLKDYMDDLEIVKEIISEKEEERIKNGSY